MEKLLSLLAAVTIFVMSGYIFYENPLEIWIEDTNEELIETLVRLRYLGTSDSLCFVEKIKIEQDEPKGLIFPTRELNSELTNSMIILAKDLSSKNTFDHINIYTRKQPILEIKFFQIPIKSIIRGGSYTIYEI